MMRRLGDGLISLLVVVVVVVWALGRAGGGGEDAPPADSGEWAEDQAGPERPEGSTLPAPRAGDPVAVVEARLAQPNTSGTAFAIGPGLWLTARHVVNGCPRIGMFIDGRRDGLAARTAWISPEADIAVLQTRGGPTPLGTDLDERDLAIGDAALHVGFPQGRPGEVESRLIGREFMRTIGDWRGDEATLAWAETRRSRGLRGTLGGLSGGPAFDANGRVIGVTIAESKRRGRVITTSAATLRSAVAEAAKQTPSGRLPAGPAVSGGSGAAETADRLRQDGRVAQILCLAA